MKFGLTTSKRRIWRQRGQKRRLVMVASQWSVRSSRTARTSPQCAESASGRASRCVGSQLFVARDAERYLSPEPLLQDPKYVEQELSGGHALAAYAYAGNNPIAYSDPTGLYPLWSPNYDYCFSRCIDDNDLRMDPMDFLPLAPFLPQDKMCLPPFRKPIKSQPFTTPLSSLANMLGGRRSGNFASFLRGAGRVGSPLATAALAGSVGYYGVGTGACMQQCLSAQSVMAGYGR